MKYLKQKKELLGTEVTNTGEETLNDTITGSQSTEDEITQSEEKNEPTVKVSSLSTGTPFIEIEDLSNKDFYSGEFYINGKVIGDSIVDKIEVSFSNETSSYPEDLYKLMTFKVGDKTFKYLASSNFKTLDFGLNEYIFSAYSGDSVYKIKVEINIPEKEIKNSANPQETRLNNEILNITDIKNLKVVNDENVSNITCESDVLTNHLVESYGYSYWNSCFDIQKDKSIGFYVLRLDGDKYFYEKHYIDYEKKLYGILLLETGTGVTKDNIKTKNYELKEKSFDETLKADRFFKN